MLRAFFFFSKIRGCFCSWGQSAPFFFVCVYLRVWRTWHVTHKRTVQDSKTNSIPSFPPFFFMVPPFFFPQPQTNFKEDQRKKKNKPEPKTQNYQATTTKKKFIIFFFFQNTRPAGEGRGGIPRGAHSPPIKKKTPRPHPNFFFFWWLNPETMSPKEDYVKCSNCEFFNLAGGGHAAFLYLRQGDRNRAEKFAEFYVRYLHQYLKGCTPSHDWPRMFRAGLLADETPKLRKKLVTKKYDGGLAPSGFYDHFIDMVEETLPEHSVTYFVMFKEEQNHGQFTRDNLCAIGCIEALEEGNMKHDEEAMERLCDYLQTEYGYTFTVPDTKLQSMAMSWVQKVDETFSNEDIEGYITDYCAKKRSKQHVHVEVTDLDCAGSGCSPETLKQVLNKNKEFVRVYPVHTPGNVVHRVVSAFAKPVQPMKQAAHRPWQVKAEKIVDGIAAEEGRKILEQLANLSTQYLYIQRSVANNDAATQGRQMQLENKLDAAVANLSDQIQSLKINSESVRQTVDLS